MSLSEGGPMDFLRSSQGYLNSSLMCSNCRRLLPLSGYRGRGECVWEGEWMRESWRVGGVDVGQVGIVGEGVERRGMRVS
jgi:hypothetical protein